MTVLLAEICEGHIPHFPFLYVTGVVLISRRMRLTI